MQFISTRIYRATNYLDIIFGSFLRTFELRPARGKPPDFELQVQKLRGGVCFSTAVFALSFIFIQPGLRAQDIFIVPNGAYQTGANWNTGVAPTAATSATINNSGTASVTTAGQAASLLNVGDTTGSGTLNVAGGTLAVTTTINAGGTVFGTINVTAGGTLTAVNGIIGGAGTVGTLTLNGAGSSAMFTSATDPALNVGNGGTATVTVSGGATLNTLIGDIREGNNGTTNATITVTGAGSTLNDGKNFDVGSGASGGSGNGVLNILNGGVVHAAGTAYVGLNGTSSGTVLIDGAGSQFTVGTSINIGEGGASTLTVSNGGSLVSTAALEVDKGTVNIGAAGGGTTSGSLMNVPQVALNNGVGISNFNFNQTNTFTEGTPISGVGSVNQNGTGTTDFNTANTYAGVTTVNAGTLSAGNAGAFGTSSMSVQGGTLEAGNGVRIITVNNTYTQVPGGTLLLVVDDTTSDRVAATGTAALGNGILSLNQTAITPPPSAPGTRTATQVYTLLTSAGLNGSRFNPALVATPLPIGDTETVTYSADDVFLNLTTPGVLFPNAGLDPNQRAVVGSINGGLANGNVTPNFIAIDNALAAAFSNGSLGADLNQLSPEEFGRFTSITAFNDASFETEAMDNYLAGEHAANGSFLAGNEGINSKGLTLNDPNYDPNLAMVHSRLLAWNPASDSSGISDIVNPMLAGVDMKDSKDMKSMAEPTYANPWNFFVRGNVILAQGISQADVGHFDDNTESVVLGTDYRITPNFLVGLKAGYGHTDVTLDNNGSSATVDSYSPGIYASYANKGWYANVMGDYIHNAYTQSRNISFLGQTANSAPEGNEGVADLDGGYDFHKGALTFGPIAGVQYTHLTVDGYNETGSVAALSVQDQQDDSLRSRVGGRVSYAFADFGMTFHPHLDATWQHEFMDQSRGITGQFENTGLGSFSVRTDSPQRDFALADVGFDADINRTVTTFVDYLVQTGQQNYFGQSVQAGLKIGF